MNVWKLFPEETYVLQGDDVVRDLMKQLRVPNLFARASEYEGMHAFVAFENHPTHWIVLHLWQGAANYSPNHSIHQFVEAPEANGLLFEAVPKASVTRKTMEDRLVSEALRMGAKIPFSFQRLPERN
ncbi:hypothetical protein ASA1KI_21360 [Opitutales bacterium ASA1]|nr:hypothetical protein ASA1KI_21360 [Opitutales bacterium ASA1]